MKGYAFQIYVLADGGEHDCVGAGDTNSWPTSVASQTLPLRGPWPYGITVQLVPEAKIDSSSHVLKLDILYLLCFPLLLLHF